MKWLVAVLLLGSAGSAAAQDTIAVQDTNAACCSIRQIDAGTKLVTARDTSSGKLVQFKVKDTQLLNTLRVNQWIRVNYRTRKVSVDGMAECCSLETRADRDESKRR